VRAFSTFGSGMCVADGKSGLEADRPTSGRTPKHIEFGGNDDEADALAEEIASLREAHEYSAQAVLCPGNARLARIGRELERRDVPVLYLGSLFEREEIKDLLSILSLLIDKRAMALVRAPGLPICDAQLSIAGATRIIDMLSTGDVAPMAWVGTASARDGLTASDETALDRLSAILEGLSEHSDPWVALVTILFDTTRIAATLSQSGSVSDRAKGMAIWQLMGFLRTIPRRTGLPIQNALEHIRRLVLLADERDLRHLPEAAKHIDAVRLMTIHASKGLEFPVVHVMGMNRGAMPSTARTPACPVPDGMIQGSTEGTVAATKADHAVEQECLFYVACSRAEDELRFYSATSDAGGRKRNPSEFLTRVGPLERIWKSPSPTRATDPELSSQAIRATSPVEVTVAQLALYERCPRRFLYTHLLRTGGRRTATTLTRLHDVIRSTVERITALDPSEVSVDDALDMFEGEWSDSEMAEMGDAVHHEIGEKL
ncbi:MAG: 3'-5' exonuclease, partial [Alteraurantiacibacter sp. bin_em_oilr2.035]|nr:3'-5' exonuclease [Alteraurantiacibacter sp. bin_em_oilr2.035]